MMPGTVIEAADVVLDESTCWLLGAGASYDCRGDGNFAVPLTESIHSASHYRSGELRSLFNELVKAGALSASDIDSAMTTHLLDTCDQVRHACYHTGSTAITARKFLRLLMYDLAEAVSAAEDRSIEFSEAFSARIPETWNLIAAYNYYDVAILAGLFPYSSVITLNYDCVLDMVFGSLQNREQSSRQYVAWLQSVEALLAGRTSDPELEEGLYIKLHGTLHAYSCLNNSCERFRQIQSPTPPRRWGYIKILKADWPCPACGEETRPLIIPPGEVLTPAESSYSDFMYKAASKRLERSSSWIILGYSCPDYDRDVQDLLSTASANRPRRGERRIYIVSPDAMAAGSRLAMHVEGRIEIVPLGFSDFATMMRGGPVSEFL
jgi:hypothetical protein